jgi:hypothetical protein
MSTKPFRFQIEEIIPLKDKVVFSQFVNWVTGEFDLFLQEEDSNGLKVYFPNGWFSIGCFKNKDLEFDAAIKIEAKSEVVCHEKIHQLMQIYMQICDYKR